MPALLDELRRRRVGRPAPAEPAPQEHPFDVEELRHAVEADQSLSEKQRKETHGFLDDPSFLNDLRKGGVGAGLGLLASKFLDLKPRNQLLLSIAGFGIGKIIYDYKKDPKKFSRWNKQLSMYEIER